MKLNLAALLLPAALLATACNEDAPPNRPSQNTLGHVLNSPGRPVQTVDDSITIPPGAAWTILCDPITTADHVQRAIEIKSQLIQLTGKKDFYVIHKDDESDIYYGFYKSIEKGVPADADEYQRSHADLNWTRTLTDSRTGQPIFQYPTLSPVEMPDPAAPAEWNLANAPADMYWSLQIAAYTHGATRKQDAIDTVRNARKMGIDAYYYHGDTVSSVCIGLWPITAVKNQQEDPRYKGGYTDDPNEAIMVLGGSRAPNNISPDMRDADGNPVKLMAMKLEIEDQSMKDMIARYPFEAVDGYNHSHGNDATGHPILDQTFLVQVPHDKQSDEAATPAPTDTRDHLPVSPDDTVPPDPTAGALRSLGDR